MAAKKLLIVESPSKAKTIEKYLDGKYTVRASVGHVRDLPKSNKKAIDIPAGFVPHYEISKGKEKVIDELASLARKSEEIILATDPDREGEAISWHVQELLEHEIGKKKIPIRRVAFNEITKEAVEEALKHPRDIDEHLVKAQEARRVLDRLFGYDLSGIIWKKVRYGLSAGRVQSPALRILMEREREIRAFVPEDYFVITADVVTAQGQAITVTCTEEPKTSERSQEILDAGKQHTWSVSALEAREEKRSPRAPFTTSTLQQSASSRLGYSPSRTMQIAQKLYEAGYITYMRTDSTTLAGSAIAGICGTIESLYGADMVAARAFKTKSKNAQEAHEAIRPTHPEKRSAGSTAEQKQLYALIWSRTVASQMADAKMMRTKITARIDDTDMPFFTVTGSRVLSPGWLLADPGAKGEDVILPEVRQGESLQLKDIQSVAKQTTPPNRYTEAGLIKELEERGIGRPSTYASIMRTLEERGYVTKEGRTLYPTDTGDVVSSFLEQHFPSYISDTFTAEMENELDDIADGKREYAKTLKDFYGPFTKDLKEKEKLDKATTLEVADEKYTCPKCGSRMVVKLGRGGKFLSCNRYPECDGALTIDGLEIKGDEPIGTHPETAEPIFVKTGRFGPYVQLGIKPEKKTKGAPKPKMASIPKEKNPTEVTLDDALKYLSLPRVLGTHPVSGKDVTANVGRFGPYVVHDGDFRSVKAPLNPYEITHEQALELLAQEKKRRGFARKKKGSSEEK